MENNRCESIGILHDWPRKRRLEDVEKAVAKEEAIFSISGEIEKVCNIVSFFSVIFSCRIFINCYLFSDILQFWFAFSNHYDYMVNQCLELKNKIHYKDRFGFTRNKID